MGGPDDWIPVSDSVKRELERRKREGESYDDVSSGYWIETTATTSTRGSGRSRTTRPT